MTATPEKNAPKDRLLIEPQDRPQNWRTFSLSHRWDKAGVRLLGLWLRRHDLDRVSQFSRSARDEKSSNASARFSNCLTERRCIFLSRFGETPPHRRLRRRWTICCPSS